MWRALTMQVAMHRTTEAAGVTPIPHSLSAPAGCWRSTRRMLTRAGEARAGWISRSRLQACKNAGMHEFAWSMLLMLLPLRMCLQLRHCFHCRT